MDGLGGGDYDRRGMIRARKVEENKVALITTCQKQRAHKAVWESNLAAAVS